MGSPLEGVVVTDLTRILAGPYCTMMLGDMGAEVIKIEVPKKGDDTRSWGPPFINRVSAYFLSINRNKKSITLNMKKDKAKTILKGLINRSDIIVENFRPGTMDELGFGYDDVKKINPRIIFCSISGFGHSGPDSWRPGYDVVIQGEGGIMSLTGFPDGPPMKVGVSIADIVAGMFACQGILMALISRFTSGRGQKVDISMLDGQVALLTYQAGIYFSTGKSPVRMGNQHPTIAPYETFRTKDGYINIAVGNDKLWVNFCNILGLSDIVNDPRFSSNNKRVENNKELKPLLEEVIDKMTTNSLMDILLKEGIPCGAIKSVEEVCNDPQVIARDMVIDIEHKIAGKIKVTGIPVKLSDTMGNINLPPPLLGEHTWEILSKYLGYNNNEIKELYEEGVL